MPPIKYLQQFISEDVCQKKWKGLRDTYLKERRKEKDKRSGSAAAGEVKRWNLSAVLSFLDPFITPRATTSNMSRVEDTAEDSPTTPATPATPDGQDQETDDASETEGTCSKTIWHFKLTPN